MLPASYSWNASSTSIAGHPTCPKDKFVNADCRFMAWRNQYADVGPDGSLEESPSLPCDGIEIEPEADRERGGPVNGSNVAVVDHIIRSIEIKSDDSHLFVLRSDIIPAVIPPGSFPLRMGA